MVGILTVHQRMINRFFNILIEGVGRLLFTKTCVCNLPVIIGQVRRRSFGFLVVYLMIVIVTAARSRFPTTP